MLFIAFQINSLILTHRNKLTKNITNEQIVRGPRLISFCARNLLTSQNTILGIFIIEKNMYALKGGHISIAILTRKLVERPTCYFLNKIVARQILN